MTIAQSEPTGQPVPPAAKARAGGRALFGSFWLDKSEFALSADVIREVVNEPARMSAVPLAPPFLLGLFNLRGTIIPVVDLRLLLEFPAREVAERKVVIVEDGDLCIGLLVDRTGEILNGSGAARVAFGRREGQIKDIVVEGLLKLDGGDRVVQILDPYEVLHLEKVPRGETLSQTRVDEPTATRGPLINCLTFQFGHTTCAIDLRDVREVLEPPEIMDSVIVHDCFIGIINLRGAIIPVADFRNFMGDGARLKSSREVPPTRKLLIVQTDGGAIGLLVYSIDSILRCFEDDILQFTRLALPRPDIVKGCILGKNEEIVLMLDHGALKRDPILVDTARRCQEVYPDALEEKRSKTKAQAAGGRGTYIVFTMDRPFAVNTAQVSEVINEPADLLRPPYKIEFIEGIINLRGELISLINPRVLYGMTSAQPQDGKVLIFKHGAQKYGLRVDRVDEIVNTTDQAVADLRGELANDRSLKVSEDVNGCVHSPTKGSVMILDTSALVRRCFDMAGQDFGDPPVGT